MPVEGNPEHRADDRDRIRLREVVEGLHLAGLRQRLEQRARKLLRRRAQRLDRARRECRRDELAHPRVLRRLKPEEAPPLDVPERLPAWIELRHAELLRLEQVPEVPPEPPVPQAGPHVLVPGDKPARQPFVVDDRCPLAQSVQNRIRVRQEPRVRGVEGERACRRHGPGRYYSYGAPGVPLAPGGRGAVQMGQSIGLRANSGARA